MTELTLDRSFPAGDTAPSRHMSKGGFLLGFYLPSIAGAAGLAAAILLLESRRTQDIGLIALLGGVVGLLIASVTMAVFLYRLWSAIPSNHARTTPGSAVGLLFVPFFNLYWVFQAFPGFVTDFNKAAADRGIEHRLRPGPFVAYAVFTLLAVVPFVGIAAVVANLVAVGLMIAAGCDAANRITAAGNGSGSGARNDELTVEGLADSTSPARSVPNDGSTALGVFCLLLVVQSAAFGILAAFAPDTDVRLPMTLMQLVFAPDILVMGLFARRGGLKIAVLTLGAITCIWRVSNVVPQLTMM